MSYFMACCYSLLHGTVIFPVGGKKLSNAGGGTYGRIYFVVWAA